MRNWILLALLILIPIAAWAGTTHFNTGGGSATLGDVNPPSGQDSYICIGENSAAGTDTFCWRSDASNDFEGSIAAYFGQIGVPSLQLHRLTINDNAIGLATEHVTWTNFAALSGGSASPNYSILTPGDSQLRTSQGCDLVGVGLGVAPVNTMSGATNDCTVRVMYNATTPAVTTYDNSSGVGTPGGTWAFCTGEIDTGVASSNTGGYGDAVLDAIGESYVVPLSSCNAANGPMVVVVEERLGAGSCDDFRAQVSLWTVEDCS